jgi:uncharacterized protein with WD repeat
MRKEEIAEQVNKQNGGRESGWAANKNISNETEGSHSGHYNGYCPWDVKSGSLVDSFEYFGGTCYLHLQVKWLHGFISPNIQHNTVC